LQWLIRNHLRWVLLLSKFWFPQPRFYVHLLCSNQHRRQQRKQGQQHLRQEVIMQPPSIKCSDQQRGIWYSSQLAMRTLAYCLSYSHRFRFLLHSNCSGYKVLRNM
jgi:hypothetical protein